MNATPQALSAARAPHLPKPVMLLLVGIPGSGKTTFAQALVQRSLLPGSPCRWVSVNQDTAAQGKRGTRAQCIRAATDALKSGDCVVIDRCHCDPEQRSSFLLLAHQHRAPAHALVMALPREACLRRAAARTGHPGGVQGPGAAQVVNAMAGQLAKPGGMPRPEEGFGSICAAKSDEDVRRALEMWAAYGGPCWRGPREIPGAEAALAAAAERTERAEREAAAAKEARKAAKKAQAAAAGASAAVAGSPAAGAAAAAAAVAEGRKRGAIQVGEEGGAAAGEEPPAKQPRAASTGAGPSPEGQSITDVLARGAQPPQTPPQQRHQEEQQQQEVQPRAERGEKAAVTHPKNAFAMLMAGAKRSSSQQKQQRHQPAGAPQQGGGSQGSQGGGNGGGGAGSSGGGGGGGVRGGPPFARVLADIARDPQRFLSDQDQPALHVDDLVVCIADKYPKARTHLLVVAREAGLDSVSMLTRRHLPLLAHMRAAALDLISQQTEGRLRPQARVQQQQQHQEEQQEPLPGGEGEQRPAGSGPSGTDPAATDVASGGGGSGGICDNDGGAAPATPPVPKGWSVGFHSVPSLRQLHLHVISTDMDSPALKNKKHWNSFCSPFFRPIDAIMSDVAASGRAAAPGAAETERLLKGEMRCNRCGAPVGTVPALKAHIRDCTAPIP